MPAPALRIGNKTAYFRKAISTPTFESESVLTREAFTFAELWLKRHCTSALPYWRQAENYFVASQHLPPEASPLTSYYCLLNASKALLTVKNVDFTEKHGVAGDIPANSKRALSNEIVTFQDSGILAALSKHLGEPEPKKDHSLAELMVNLPFIHRAFRHTFKSQNELFIPLQNVIYRKHPKENYVWFSAEIKGRFADARILKTLPERFEVDKGYTDKCVIRTRKRIRWHSHGAPSLEKQRALARLHTFHRAVRLDVPYISAPTDLWYLKRCLKSTGSIRRYGLTLTMAAMHRLSELSRYDPKGLSGYFDGQANWLLTEFIQLAPAQFIDELICELTSLELRLPGIRP